MIHSTSISITGSRHVLNQHSTKRNTVLSTSSLIVEAEPKDLEPCRTANSGRLKLTRKVRHNTDSNIIPNKEHFNIQAAKIVVSKLLWSNG